MNLNTSDLRLNKQTVTVNTLLLKKLQQSLNKKMKTLRSEGKLTKATFSILCLFSFGLSESKAITTFTEGFDNNNANWGDAGSDPIGWKSSGGADGGGYITTNASFSDPGQGVLFRAHDEFFLPDKTGSSGGAFEGNWIAGNVAMFSVSVRHNAPVPLTFYSRFASSVNFPGGTAVSFAPVFADTWTELQIPIDPTNRSFVTYEGSTFEGVFSNIGHVQIGASGPDGFENNPAVFTFDLDSAGITVIPEPSGSILLIAGSALFLLRRRRRS